MTKLETMARELFTKFSLQEKGKPSNWKLLSTERKVEWMKDVLMVGEHFMKELQSTVKPLPNVQRHETVYSAGYHEGSRNERMGFLQLVSEVQEKLEQELEDFKENNK